jgi:hypothetical protein
MSVAQVLNTSGGPGGPPPPGAELPPEMDKLLAATKALDGLEHIYVMGNEGTGQTILVWRDEAAMKAAAEHIAADNVTVGNVMGMTLTVGPIYSSFVEL